MPTLYQVGGSVRDALMGIEPHDFDYSVECNSYAEMVEFIKSIGKIYLEKPEFGTVRGHLNKENGGHSADFVLCRRDGTYSDGRRPDFIEVGTIFDDLARRDFTMNAIAINVKTGEYIDPYFGREDIAEKQIRAVGFAFDRLNEDPLRMLRALRFAITKGFELDPELEYCLNKIELLYKLKDSVSNERKREELRKCFEYNTILTLNYLNEFPALTQAVLDSIWLMPTLRGRKYR